jgi:M6 family metalloprotease-like protein
MAESGPANPYPFEFDNHEEGPAVTLFHHGSSPLDSVVSDAEGYTVILDRNTSKFVYAMKNNASGELVSSGIAVGDVDPEPVGIAKKLRASSSFFDRRNPLEGHQPQHHRALAVPSTGILKNLVVLVRFRNHKRRILPTADDFDILFNHEGEDDDHHHELAPTGSVRDVFRINSYGKITLESTIFGWVDLPETEAYYAAGVGGFATPEYAEALHSAMDALRDDLGVSDFSEFDGDSDGRIDMVTLVHSGYASEVTGADQDGAANDDRIWSHHKKLSKKRRWYPDPDQKKNGDAYVYQYSTVPALYGAEGSSIGRIGVTCHEIGHSIGENIVDSFWFQSSFLAS